MHLTGKRKNIKINMTEILIHRIKQKERKAQEEFYKKYSPRMFRLIYRYIGNETDAGSILNMGFFKIFNKIDQLIYINDICFIAWMKKIMINESLMFLRQHCPCLDIDHYSDELYDAEDMSPDHRLKLEDYDTLIRHLPHELRTVFNLYAIDGFSHKEIAAELNIKESSSRVYLTRARVLLQKSLTELKSGYGK
jgi:RNA polymerase sigma factor (sigma-70 family)